MLTVRFRITIDNKVNRQMVIKNLRDSLPPGKIWSSSELRDIFYEAKFSDKDASKALNRMSQIYNTNHIQKVVPFPTERFSRQNLVPMLISAGISFVTIYSILLGLKIELGQEEYLTLLIIPTLVGFGTEILHRVF